MENKNIASTFSEMLHRFHSGTETRAWEYFGAHTEMRDGVSGTVFRLWAPHAQEVSLICSANGWMRELNPMTRLAEDSSVWICFLPELHRFDCYKYSIRTKEDTFLEKADPYAFHAETRPYNASKVYTMEGYAWHDTAWREAKHPADNAPMNIYEVHLGSWRVREDSSFYSYRELAETLIPYVCDMGYTHLELLPLTEHPYDGSWGYQTLGWFAATSRYGTPHDLMYFIDRCHQAGLGVILDWSAAGFPSDAHGLICFDGESCYECTPPEDEMAYGMRRFNLSRPEVRSFLLSSAEFWISQFHLDGLRVSSVQPMLFLDYDRADGHWTANRYGENLDWDGAELLRMLCSGIKTRDVGTLMLSSSAGMWPSVTKPTDFGGLGFDCMWRDDWVAQALAHIQTLPEGAEEFSDWLTLTLLDSTDEHYILPLSHDAVSHGDGSLLSRMPGDYANKFTALRTLYGFVMAHPGGKLLFMGSEFGQFTEWACHHELDWSVLDYEAHCQLHHYVRALNWFYKSCPALWSSDAESFRWAEREETNAGIFAFERYGAGGERLLAAVNLTNNHIGTFAVTVDGEDDWTEVFSSDAAAYSGVETASGVRSQVHSAGSTKLVLRIPAQSIRFYQPNN